MILKLSEIETKFGKLRIVFDNNALLLCTFGFLYFEELKNLYPGFKFIPSYKNIYKDEINQYFDGNRKQFTLIYKLSGTDFQKKVWKETINIKYGKTATYKEIAEKINNPNAARAVGNALNKNRLALIVPCHRIIRSNGNPGGFAAGRNIKRKLLNLENNHKENI